MITKRKQLYRWTFGKIKSDMEAIEKGLETEVVVEAFTRTEAVDEVYRIAEISNTSPFYVKRIELITKGTR